MRLKRPESRLAFELMRLTANQEGRKVIDESLALIGRIQRVIETTVSETLFPDFWRASSYSLDKQAVQSDDMKKYSQINEAINLFINHCYAIENNPFVQERQKKTTCFLSLFNSCGYMKPDKFDIKKVLENEELQSKYTKLLSEMKRMTSNHENAVTSPLHGC